MDTLRGVVHFVGVTVTLIFVLSVSGAFGDEMKSGWNEGSLIRGEAVGTSWGSARFADQVTGGWQQGGFETVETFLGSRFADFNSGLSFGQDEVFERTNGIREGYWLRLSMDNHYSSNSSGPVGGSSTAMPEPASLLLLVTGVGPLLYARRRALKA